MPVGCRSGRTSTTGQYSKMGWAGRWRCGLSQYTSWRRSTPGLPQSQEPVIGRHRRTGRRITRNTTPIWYTQVEYSKKESGMQGKKLIRWIAALSLVASLNVSSLSGSSAAQNAAASTAIRMKRASADSEPAADTGRNGKIAFLRNRGGAVDVYVVNPSGMTPVNLTRSRANELYVDWSPNGRHVVFTRFGKGAGNLFRISRSGKGLPAPLPNRVKTT